MLLLLLGQCRGNAAALESVGGTGMVADLLGDPDPRLRYHAACFLQVLTQLVACTMLRWHHAGLHETLQALHGFSTYSVRLPPSRPACLTSASIQRCVRACSHSPNLAI